MGAFEYVVLDASGKEKKGSMEGDTARHVRQQLRDQGLMPLSVEEVAEKEKSGGGGGGFRRGVSSADLALITRQLSTLVRASLPLEEALRTVSQQTEKPHIKRMMLSIRSRVMEGHTLADGFSDFPRVFNELYRATVKAGEQTGHLDTVLDRLADYTEIRQALQQKIMQAMIYPAVLTLISVAVISGLLTYVVPQIVEVFTKSGQALPKLTEFLILISEFLQNYGIVLLILIAAGVVAFSYSMRNESFKFRVHQTMLKLPLIAKITRGLNTSRFARTFSILTGSGVPVLDGLRISSQVISNLPMRFAVEEATSRIREGGSIGRSLEQAKQFPPMTLNLIQSGESSGKLEEMLERAAISQEREIESMIGTMLALLEPLLIVSMGGIVMIIVMAVLLPIFEMNNLIT